MFAEIQDYQVIKGEGRDPNNEWTPEQSFLVVGISRKKAIDLAVKFGQRAIVYGETNQSVELIETLFTMGNCEIIRQHKTAFLCSRKVPAGIILKCYDWAIAQREAGSCVISGFHSTIEKDVLHYLLKGKQPLIVVFARGLKKQLEPEFIQPLEQGRLLIISPFEQKIKRASKETAARRNKLMIELADKVAFGHISSGGSLEKLMNDVKKEVSFIQ